MLFIVSAVKLTAEIALMAFLGKWLLGVMVGPRRDSNVFYAVLVTVTRPFVRLARRVTPAFVLDRHLPPVAFFMLSALWLAATVVKIGICVQIGVALCR